MFVEKRVILSIKPIYAEKILSGHKSWELRKSAPVFFNRLVVFMYASSPVKQVVGMFECNLVYRMPVCEFWNEFGQECGISEEEFLQYYHGYHDVIAWRVGNVHPFEPVFGLDALGLSRPPLSWQIF